MEEAGRIVPIEAALALELNSYIESRPWHATRLDWSEQSFLDIVFDEEAHRVGETPLGSHSHGIVLVGQKGFSFLLEDELHNLDEIAWGSPGFRYLCGADDVGGSLVPVVEHFAEYDGKHTLRIALSP